MVGDEDTDIQVFQFPHDKLDILHGDGIDTGKRFIEHNEFRFDGQTTGDLRPSALTTRELITLVLTYLLQTKLGDQALQFLHLILTWFARHLQYRKDIILHAHLTEDTGLLGQIADTRTGSFIHRVVGHLMVAQVDMAAVRQHQSCCHVERGGLTGTVRSEQTDDLPLFHMKTDVVDHSALPIALDEAFRA